MSRDYNNTNTTWSNIHDYDLDHVGQRTSCTLVTVYILLYRYSTS